MDAELGARVADGLGQDTDTGAYGKAVTNVESQANRA